MTSYSIWQCNEYVSCFSHGLNYTILEQSRDTDIWQHDSRVYYETNTFRKAGFSSLQTIFRCLYNRHICPLTTPIPRLPCNVNIMSYKPLGRIENHWSEVGDSRSFDTVSVSRRTEHFLTTPNAHRRRNFAKWLQILTQTGLCQIIPRNGHLVCPESGAISYLDRRHVSLVTAQRVLVSDVLLGGATPTPALTNRAQGRRKGEGES